MRGFISKMRAFARKMLHIPREHVPEIFVMSGMGLAAFAVTMWSFPAGLLTGAVGLILVGIDFGRP